MNNVGFAQEHGAGMTKRGTWSKDMWPLSLRKSRLCLKLLEEWLHLHQSTGPLPNWEIAPWLMQWVFCIQVLSVRLSTVVSLLMFRWVGFRGTPSPITSDVQPASGSGEAPVRLSPSFAEEDYEEWPVECGERVGDKQSSNHGYSGSLQMVRSFASMCLALARKAGWG